MKHPLPAPRPRERLHQRPVRLGLGRRPDLVSI
jgi:hypothetical protein